MINFPSSPSEGQKFINGAVAYTFAGGVWNAAPLETALPFNYIVNPVMRISQQNGDTAAPAGVTGVWYPADQWVGNWVMGAGSFNSLRSRPAPSGADWIAIQVVTPVASPTAAAYIQFYQWIEGNRIADLQWGTAAAKQVIFRFSFWSHLAGTYTAVVRNALNDRSFLAPFVFAGPGWQTYSIVIPGDTTGTWPTGTGSGLNIGCGFAAGTTYGGGVAGWQAGNKLAMTGATNGAGLAGGTYFAIADVGLYLDPLSTGRAPPFEPPSERQAMADCLRYWYPLRHGRGNTISTVSSHRSGGRHPVPMRVAPAYAIVGTGGVVYEISSAPAVTSVAASVGNEDVAELNLAGASGAMVAGRGNIYTSTTAANYIAVSARM